MACKKYTNPPSKGKIRPRTKPSRTPTNRQGGEQVVSTSRARKMSGKS